LVLLYEICHKARSHEHQNHECLYGVSSAILFLSEQFSHFLHSFMYSLLLAVHTWNHTREPNLQQDILTAGLFHSFHQSLYVATGLLL